MRNWLLAIAAWILTTAAPQFASADMPYRLPMITSESFTLTAGLEFQPPTWHEWDDTQWMIREAFTASGGAAGFATMQDQDDFGPSPHAVMSLLPGAEFRGKWNDIPYWIQPQFRRLMDDVLGPQPAIPPQRWPPLVIL